MLYSRGRVDRLKVAVSRHSVLMGRARVPVAIFPLSFSYRGVKKMKQIHSAWLIVLGTMLGACVDSSVDLEADREAISALHEREIEAVFASDSDALTGVYSEDAVLMPPNGASIEGAEAVETWSRSLFDQVAIQGDVAVTDLTLAGDWAIERYEYSFQVSPLAGGDPVQDEGKGLHIFRRQSDGTWRISVDIWNPNGPPASGQ